MMAKRRRFVRSRRREIFLPASHRRYTALRRSCRLVMATLVVMSLTWPPENRTTLSVDT